MKMFKRFCNQKNNFAITSAVALVLVFFAPLDFYFSNKDDVWYDFYNIIKWVSANTVKCFIGLIIFWGLICLIPKVGEYISSVIRFVLIYFLLAFYIQGNYVPIPYGAIDGTPIVWHDYWIQDITSVLLWIGIFTILLIAKLKLKEEQYERLEFGISFVLIGICVFTLIVEFGFSGGLNKKIEKRSTVKNEWMYSANKNFNILVMDSLDSRVFTDLVRDNNEEVQSCIEALDGFTFYRDTMGCYNLTDYSVPMILTGELYLGQSTYGEFIEGAYNNSPLISRLTEEGWNKNIYVNVALPQGKVADEIDNLSEMRLSPIYEDKFESDVYKTVAFRYMPNPLKRYFYDYFFEVGANRMAEEGANSKLEKHFEWENVLWYNGFLENEVQLVDDNVFHYYHISGIHPPRQYHSDFEFTTNRVEVSLEEGEILCFKIIQSWIEYLKEIGAYDNSVIVIMADHGAWEFDISGNASQAPLLMIKGYDEHHELLVNSLPVSYIDMQRCFDALLDNSSSQDCFNKIFVDKSFEEKKRCNSWKELYNDVSGDYSGRLRPFFFSYLMNEMQQNTVGGPFYEGVSDKTVYTEDGIYWTENRYGGK